jgi:hypothetical protein
MDEILSVLEVLTAAVKFAAAVLDFVKLLKKNRAPK